VIVAQREPPPVAPLIPDEHAILLIVIFQPVDINAGFQSAISSQEKVPADLVPDNSAQKLANTRCVIKIHLSQGKKKRAALLIEKDTGIIQDDAIPFFYAQSQSVPRIQKKSPPIAPTIDQFQLESGA
jgi:hypothetical protein